VNKQTDTRPSLCVRFPAAYQVEMEEAPVAAQPGPKQLLVKTLYSLISPGTELAMYTQTHIGFSDPTNTYAKYPFYPGYTAVGRIEAAGSEVQGFASGDTLFYSGRHQTYSLVTPDQDIIMVIPQGVPHTRVPFIRMAEISFTSLLMSDLRPGDTVAVLGLGLVGNLAAQLFQIHGARVIGVDLVPFRRELARQAGIEQTVAAEQQDAVSAVRELAGGDGPRIVVEATGSPLLVPSALAMAREKGEVILLGSTRGTVELDVYNLIHRRGVTLKGAHGRLVPRRSQDGSIDQVAVDKRMLQWLQEGRLKVDHLVTERVRPLQGEVERAYQALLNAKDSTMAILIDWT
jgi:threonine dehydrogenase-like Zn-dependent dehydrogenase